MLDQLAKNSLSPENALSNGRPTIFEFYADWCEVCREMSPAMLNMERKYLGQINIVLLNVDNSRWLDLIEAYFFELHQSPSKNFHLQYFLNFLNPFHSYLSESMGSRFAAR